MKKIDESARDVVACSLPDCTCTPRNFSAEMLRSIVACEGLKATQCLTACSTFAAKPDDVARISALIPDESTRKSIAVDDGVVKRRRQRRVLDVTCVTAGSDVCVVVAVVVVTVVVTRSTASFSLSLKSSSTTRLTAPKWK